jgi:hypothetical protein
MGGIIAISKNLLIAMAIIPKIVINNFSNNRHGD